MKRQNIAVPGLTCVVLIDKFLMGEEPPLSRKRLKELLSKFGKYDEIFLAVPDRKINLYKSYIQDEEEVSIITIKNGEDEKQLLKNLLTEIAEYQYAIFHPLNDPMVSPFILKIFEDMIKDHNAVILRIKNKLDPWRAIYDIQNILDKLESLEEIKMLDEFLEKIGKTLVIDDFALRSFEKMGILYEKIEKAKDLRKFKRY